jgi:hypothetical protein
MHDLVVFAHHADSRKPLRLICECKKPQHPDHLIIKCSTQACGVWLHASCLARDIVQRKNEQDEITVATNGKRRSRKSVSKNNIKSTADAVAENENITAKVVAPESGAPKFEIVDNKTGEETEEPVHCLVCKELIE